MPVGVPWRDAHVRSGPRQDAAVWEEHLACCTQLLALRQEFAPGVSTVIAGDFNQRIPRARQPARVEAALNAALAGMTVWTRGETACGPLIDHIAASDDFAADSVEPWHGHDDHGRLSDHAGVACTLHRI